MRSVGAQTEHVFKYLINTFLQTDRCKIVKVYKQKYSCYLHQGSYVKNVLMDFYDIFTTGVLAQVCYGGLLGFGGSISSCCIKLGRRSCVLRQKFTLTSALKLTLQLAFNPTGA